MHQPASATHGSRLSAYPAPQQADHAPGQHGHQSGQPDKSARGDQPQPHIAGLQPEQYGKRRQSGKESQDWRGLQLPQRATQHGQRRNAGESQNGRQAESEQKQHAGQRGEQRRLPARRRQLAHLHPNQAMQQPQQSRLHRKPDDHAERCRHAAEPEKLAGITAQQHPLPQPQRLEHRAGLQPPPCKVARRLGHGNCRHQRGDQGDQMQEIRRALERLLLRGSAIGHRFDTHAALGLVLDLCPPPVGIRRDGLRWPGDGKAIRHPAGGLDQSGRRQIGLVHHHPGREIDESRAGVRFAHQNRSDAETRVAELQQIAHLQTQRAEQASADPHRAWVRCTAVGTIRLRQTTAQRDLRNQRVVRPDRLERRQPGVIPRHIQRHAGKHRRLHVPQAQGLRLLQIHRGQGMIAHHHHVTANQLRRVAHQRAMQPLRHEADRCQRRNGKHQGKKQEAQFTATPIAPELSQGLHGNSFAVVGYRIGALSDAAQVCAGFGAL
ncbi:hypothetical protein GALL_433880 [mine drainage metagenome]|uniref:Uncharacterized protein n=1 Tax=mine drainage metagenome TaxID=410659 RepID=A0A1J5PU10_9ZZZZ